MAEFSTYDFDWTPRGWDALDRPDLYAWHWPAPNASSRGVARASFGDAELAARVGELREFFERHGRTARWHLDSTNRSPALAALLHERAGAVHEPRNMTAELAITLFRSNPDVRVEEVRSAELARRWIERCFPDLSAAQIADDVERWSVRFAASTRRGGDLVAFIGDDLVGSASWRDSSEGDCVQLVGGWTLPSMRRRGVYSTLCAYRVARAVERGLRYACIVADPTTSGPIVARAGFIDHGPHYIFTDVHL